MSIFSERLKYERKRNGISQKDLAADISVHCSTVSLWENGIKKPGLENAVDICRRFGVSLDYMSGLSDNKHLLCVDGKEDVEYMSKYLGLDSRGRATVRALIDAEIGISSV